MEQSSSQGHNIEYGRLLALEHLNKRAALLHILSPNTSRTSRVYEQKPPSPCGESHFLQALDPCVHLLVFCMRTMARVRSST